MTTPKPPSQEAVEPYDWCSIERNKMIARNLDAEWNRAIEAAAGLFGDPRRTVNDGYAAEKIRALKRNA